MKYSIPGELWNQVEVPAEDSTLTLVEKYLAEMAYKLPSVTDIMMTKEYWHTVCDFAERTGALRETTTQTLSESNHSVTPSPTIGHFQRFVGASVGGTMVGFSGFTTADTASGPTMTFTATSGLAKVSYSVTPELDAAPANQKVPLWFLKKYDRALLAGTLMRLQAMGGRPWFDADGARMNATTYIREINRITHGLITAGMRKVALYDAEAIIAGITRSASQQQAEQ